MAYSNGMITAPVSMRDVQKALGVGSGDVGTLCRSTMINMWAKFKPIYHSGVGLLINSQRQDNSHTVSGYAISWGIMKPAISAWSDYIDLSDGVVKPGVWGYDRPQGGNASPYRLTDFVEVNNSGVATGNGYSHGAKCPIQITLSQNSEIPVPYSAIEDGNTLMFLFTFQNGVIGWSASHSLSIAEIFADEQSYYPTVIFTCYYNGRIYEYAKSGDNRVSYYTGNVNPVVQVPIDTKVLAQSVINDGGSYHTGALADNASWTACMVLVRDKVAGTTTEHTINNNQIRRLEYSTGVDRKIMVIKNTTKLDALTALSYTINIRKSSNGVYYYVESIVVSVTTRYTGSSLSFGIDASFSCLVGVIGGTGWAGTNQYEYKEKWASLYLPVEDTGKTITKTLYPITGLPEYRFTGDVYPGQRIAAGDLSFTSSGMYKSGSFSFNVANGLSSYSQTVTII